MPSPPPGPSHTPSSHVGNSHSHSTPSPSQYWNLQWSFQLTYSRRDAISILRAYDIGAVLTWLNILRSSESGHHRLANEMLLGPQQLRALSAIKDYDDDQVMTFLQLASQTAMAGVHGTSNTSYGIQPFSIDGRLDEANTSPSSTYKTSPGPCISSSPELQRINKSTPRTSVEVSSSHGESPVLQKPIPQRNPRSRKSSCSASATKTFSYSNDSGSRQGTSLVAVNDSSPPPSPDPFTLSPLHDTTISADTHYPNYGLSHTAGQSPNICCGHTAPYCTATRAPHYSYLSGIGAWQARSPPASGTIPHYPNLLYTDPITTQATDQNIRPLPRKKRRTGRRNH